MSETPRALQSEEAFREHYRRGRWYSPAWSWRLLLNPTLNLWQLGFALRFRVPDGQGYFGRGVKGASWCCPWNWYRRYYQNRRHFYFMHL